jgi:hypothetical protein
MLYIELKMENVINRQEKNKNKKSYILYVAFYYRLGLQLLIAMYSTSIIF